VSRSNEPLQRTLSPEPGTQILLSVGSMRSPLSMLPTSTASPVVVVSSDSPTELSERLASADADLSTVGHIPISGSEFDYNGRMWTCDSLVPDDLTGLSMRLSQAFEAIGDSGGWLLVENLNVFLLYASEERVIRFMDHITALAAEHDINGVYTVTREAIAADTYDRVRLSVDEAVGDEELTGR